MKAGRKPKKCEWDNCFSCIYPKCIVTNKQLKGQTTLRPTDIPQFDNVPESYTNTKRVKVFKPFNYTGLY